MVKAFLLVFLILFAVVGICELIYILKMFLFFPGFRVKNYSLIVLKSGSALKQMDYIWQKNKWYGDSYASGVIALTDNIKEKELLECSQYVREKNIVLCSATSISEYL